MSFWDNVAGGTITPARPQAPVYPQAPVQPVLPPQSYPQIPQGYPQQYPGVPQEDPAIASAKAKALSSRSTLTCPNCFSDNVCKPSANVMESCYNCGWNPRFTQSTAGAGMPSASETGPAQPARQISTANNFNPQTIVATVGV